MRLNEILMIYKIFVIFLLLFPIINGCKPKFTDILYIDKNDKTYDSLIVNDDINLIIGYPQKDLYNYQYGNDILNNYISTSIFIYRKKKNEVRIKSCRVLIKNKEDNIIDTYILHYNSTGSDGNIKQINSVEYAFNDFNKGNSKYFDLYYSYPLELQGNEIITLDYEIQYFINGKLYTNRDVKRLKRKYDNHYFIFD